MQAKILSLATMVLVAAAAPAMAQAAAGTSAKSPPGYDQQYEAARALANSGQRDAAIEAYSDLLAHSPGNADVLLGRGQVYARMGRWPEAEEDLLAVTAGSPRYVDAWSALGDMYLWSDRPRQATAAFGHWVDLRPTDPEPRIARARAYRTAGEYESARLDFEAARGLGADSGEMDQYLLTLTPRINKPEAAVPEGYLWSATLGASWTRFSPTRNDWTDGFASIRRRFDHGSLALEFLDARRFGTSDQAWALDGYRDLWDRAYVNLRFQHGPDAALYPERAYYGELFQGVDRGWEFSSSYSRLEFANSTVNSYGIGVGRYFNNYYVRLRHLYTPSSGSRSNSDRLLVRYYYAGDGDNYVEVTGGIGRTDADIPGNTGSSLSTNSSTIGVAFVKFPTPRWGFRIGADYGDDSDGFTSRGLFASLYRRW
ncbi:MAG: YaiO family outer membrane beta-barrel protein [Gammaproteobacteria bacterium]